MVKSTATAHKVEPKEGVKLVGQEELILIPFGVSLGWHKAACIPSLSWYTLRGGNGFREAAENTQPGNARPWDPNQVSLPLKTMRTSRSPCNYVSGNEFDMSWKKSRRGWVGIEEMA